MNLTSAGRFVLIFLLLLPAPRISLAAGMAHEQTEDKALLQEIRGLRSELKAFFTVSIETQRHLGAINRLENQLAELEKEIAIRESNLKSTITERDSLDKGMQEYELRAREYDVLAYKWKVLIDHMTDKSFDIKQKIERHQNEISRLVDKAGENMN